MADALRDEQNSNRVTAEENERLVIESETLKNRLRVIDKSCRQLGQKLHTLKIDYSVLEGERNATELKSLHLIVLITALEKRMDRADTLLGEYHRQYEELWSEKRAAEENHKLIQGEYQANEEVLYGRIEKYRAYYFSLFSLYCETLQTVPHEGGEDETGRNEEEI